MGARFPLHDAHAAAGAVFETRHGWEQPVSYGDPAGEYAAVRGGVGLIDRGDLGVVTVSGRDRASFMHALLSNEIKSLTPGQGCRASLLDVHGKVQVILTVLVGEEEILLLTPAGQAAATLEALDRFLFSEKVILKDTTGALAILVLAGPGAAAVVGERGGSLPGQTAWSHRGTRVDGVEVELVRGGPGSSEDEIWLLGPAADGSRLWETIRGAGARPVGYDAQEALRIEAGVARYGVDVDGTVLLPEIPLADLVSSTKGCYIGQEVVVRVRDRGHVNRHLRGLLVEGPDVPPPGAMILSGEVEIGRVTSAAWSYGRGRPVALGFVRRQHAAPGTSVALRAGDRCFAATVADLPFAR